MAHQFRNHGRVIDASDKTRSTEHVAVGIELHLVTGPNRYNCEQLMPVTQMLEATRNLRIQHGDQMITTVHM